MSVGIVAVTLVAAVLLYQRVQPAPRPAVEEWPTADLPKHVWRTRYSGRVRVTFQFPLAPTADPRVFLYHPGHPAKVAPPTYRVHFAEPPSLPTGAVLVEGTAEPIAPDLVRRTNGVPGVLVLTAAVPVSP